MSRFELGQPVAMTGTVEKVREYPHTRYVEAGIPYRVGYPSNRTYSEGVIVGSRTVQEGIASYDDEHGRQFGPTIGKAKRVWLVAFHLRRKPVMCFDHQLSAVAP